MLSFIIPAHNEERCLPDTLAAVVAAADAVGRPYEVIVVNDASTDRTRDLAVEHTVRVVDVAHRQIAATRNAGARAATGDILFFVDADTQATAAAIEEGLAALEQGAVGGGCHFRYDGPIPFWARIMHPLGSAAGRWLAVTGGAFLFCRRADFDAVGGFNERYFAAEDLVFIRAMKERGRFVIPRALVRTSNRKLDSLSPWDVIRLLFRFAVSGPESFRNRDELGLWYGPEARAVPEASRER